jgi:hypothetical protein
MWRTSHASGERSSNGTFSQKLCEGAFESVAVHFSFEDPNEPKLFIFYDEDEHLELLSQRASFSVLSYRGL